jgi:flagellar biosynthesis protein FlhF
MKILKFEGASMRETLAKVKAELGDQAVVVSTRQIRRGLLGSAYEIAAAIDQDDDGPTVPAPVPARPMARPTLDDGEVERVVAPLRAELRSLRAMMRARADERPAPNPDLREELAALRRAVEQLRGAPAAAAPAPAPAPAPTPAPVVEPPLATGSTARVVMLVGPTGVGKTTSIAKIAARAALIEGRQVAIVTLDNYRVGGIDQIRTYADLIGVPLHVVEDPAGLGDVLVELAAYDLVLVDTAGKSPRDRAALAALATCARRAGAEVEVHLTIAAATAPAVIDELAQRFAPLRPRRLLFTKVDECGRVPELTLTPKRLGLPVTWLATGQAVPEDLELATVRGCIELAATASSTTRRRPDMRNHRSSRLAPAHPGQRRTPPPARVASARSPSPAARAASARAPSRSAWPRRSPPTAPDADGRRRPRHGRPQPAAGRRAAAQPARRARRRADRRRAGGGARPTSAARGQRQPRAGDLGPAGPALDRAGRASCAELRHRRP